MIPRGDITVSPSDECNRSIHTDPDLTDEGVFHNVSQKQWEVEVSDKNDAKTLTVKLRIVISNGEVEYL